MRQFSTEHLAALGVTAAAAALSIATARRGSERAVRLLSRSLALVILAGWIGEQIADVVEGIWSVKYTLPLQLTDVVSVVAVVALLRPRPLPVELTWFWALTATLQATLTPDLSRTFPERLLLHLLRLPRRSRSWPRACWSSASAATPARARRGACSPSRLAWAAVAGAADLVTGGNYMYLRAKPVHSSLLSVMARWPWYILETAVRGVGHAARARRRSPISCDVAIAANDGRAYSPSASISSRARSTTPPQRRKPWTMSS